jgi:uncharacterized membrane protein YhhN
MSVTLIFLSIFVVVSVVHVSAIVLRKGKLRRLSKTLIIPPLLAAYIACVTGAGNQLLFPIPALILGWIGDILLIKIQKKINFQLGLASFLLGHLCYIAAFIDLLGFFGGAGKINVFALIIAIPLALILGIATFRFIKPPKEMFIPVIMYTIVLEAMTFWSLQVFLFKSGFAGLLVFSGAVSFMISDTILAYYTFRKLKLPAAVLIMVTYILAQAGIVLGLLLLTALF